MADVVLDANVLVGWLDQGDALAGRSRELLARLRAEGNQPVLIDICIGEAISVVCRRARERKLSPPHLEAVVERIRAAAERGEIRFVADEARHLIGEILEVVKSTGGRLNFNDGLLVVLQRNGLIGDVASFDEGFRVIPDFRRLD